ncbi:MAG TPA: RNase H family protein [Armatimonadota bacterium]|jgi:ribonuclease HI
MRQYEFWVDGACSGNQFAGAQPMGGGVVARCGDWERDWSIPLGGGTNQLAELLVVVEALSRIKDRPDADVIVYSDSAYAIGCLTQPWKPKANLEAIAKAKALIRECGRFRMVKVSGHSGHPENERADRLAVKAIASISREQ